MKPKPKQFTRANPCTKLHIWNCFRLRGGFISVPVVEAQAQIGIHTPRNMLRRGRMVETTGEVDVYTLTPEGEQWLLLGIVNYLKRHPSDLEKVKHLPNFYN